MWTAITAVLILALGAPQEAAGPPLGERPETTQEGKLSVANERLTYGHLGPTRPTAAYLPGDVIHLDFDVRNLKFDADGRAVLDEIQSIRAQEAALAVKVKAPKEAATQREELETRRLALEKKLASRSATAGKLANPWVELRDVQKRIAADAMLIDIASFRVNRIDDKTGDKIWAPARYVAWLTPPRKERR